MKVKKEKIVLPDGEGIVDTVFFDKKDLPKFRKIFCFWQKLSKLSKELKAGRTINLPEALSEGLFCLETGAVKVKGKIPGTNSSFDCYNLKTKKRIQVKGASSRGPTSFGPRSEWDELYFIDFYNNGNIDGTYKIFLIKDNFLNNCKLNKKQSFKAQQKQGRRPRINLYEKIIEPNNIKPTITGKL